jgi:predicted amidohydrolase
MKICVAQTRPVKGNIAANIEMHKKFTALAVSYQADAIFFPELSVTGYEPVLAKELATEQNDRRLDDFQKNSDIHQITIGLGIPTKSEKGIQISMVIFQPGKPRLTYSKQQLHEDEFPYFVCGNGQVLITVSNKKIAPAICYESLQANHAENANRLGAEIYVASVAKSQKGIDKVLLHFPAIAKKYAMTVLMSNCVGYCDNFESYGNSAVWDNEGNLIGKLCNKEEGMLIFDTVTNDVIETTI